MKHNNLAKEFLHLMHCDMNNLHGQFVPHEKLCHKYEAGTGSWANTRKSKKAIKFNEEAGLKPWVDMNMEPRTKVKNDFQKDSVTLKSNSLVGKTMENVINHRDIRLKQRHRGN